MRSITSRLGQITMRRSFSRLPALLLCTTAAFGGVFTVASSAFAAFDPNADSTTSLPDTAVLYDGAPSNNRQIRPLYPERVGAPLIPITPPATFVPAPAAPTALPAATIQPISPPAPIAATTTTTLPAPTITSQQSPVAYQPTISAPPITAYTPPTTPAPQEGFIAPAPVFATQTPTIIAPPAPATSAMAAAPTPAPTAQPLSSQTQAILSHIPSRMDTKPVKPTTHLAVNRVSPNIKTGLGKDPKDASYDAAGISIKVRRPGLDTNFELNRAYTALMGGDTESAISIYKDVINADPGNQDALFSLATIYQRIGELDKARPLYGALFKINPNHREGLNNFLAMVSEESPQEALAELERLEERNPDFSPIPAQEAIVLNKLGYMNESRDKMLRAIELAPDNLTYKYNLAVMLDTRGDYANAGPIYQQLIKASLEGEKLPVSTEVMQKRLNFITATAAQTQANGG